MSKSLDQYAGRCHNAGYHGMLLEVKDGKLYTDCSDRCFAFELWFEHVSEDSFVVAMRAIQFDIVEKISAMFRLTTSGVVEALGMNIVKEMESEPIWFTRVK